MRRGKIFLSLLLTCCARAILGRRLLLGDDQNRGLQNSDVVNQLLPARAHPLHTLAATLFTFNPAVNRQRPLRACSTKANRILWPIQNQDLPKRRRDTPMQFIDTLKNTVAAPSSEGIVDRSPKQESLPLEEVLNTLKADIPKFFQREPDWSIYANDFNVKLSLESVGIFKLLGSRGMNFVLKDDVFLEVLSGNASKPIVLVRMKAQIERQLNFAERAFRFFYMKSEPSIEVEALLKLNDMNQVSQMEIPYVSVDGRQIIQIPQVEVKSDPSFVWNRAVMAVSDRRARRQVLLDLVDGPLANAPKADGIDGDLRDRVVMLKRDILNLRTPSRDTFADDFYVKTSREGIQIFKVLDDLLSSAGNMTLALKFYNPGRFFFEKDTDSGLCLLAHWKVQLKRPLNLYEQAVRSIFFALSQREDKDLEFITLEADNVFHFNDNFQVDFLRIDNLIVDGRKVAKWPEAQVKDDPIAIWKRIDMLIQRETKVDPLKKMQEFLRSVKLSGLDLADTLFSIPVDEDLKTVVEKLKVDISQFFRKEPNWDIFAEDFYVKTSLEGSSLLKLIERNLLVSASKLEIQNDVPVRFSYDSDLEAFLVARWEFRLPRKLNVVESKVRDFIAWARNPSSTQPSLDYIGFECETAFHFNDRKQIDYMRIDNLIVDRREVAAFPEYKVSEDPAVILDRVRMLINDTQQPETLNLKDWASINMFDLNAKDVVQRWRGKAMKSYSASDLDRVKQKLSGSKEILSMIEEDMQWATPDKIIILTFAQNALSREDVEGFLDILRKGRPLSQDSPEFQLGFVFAVATASEETVFDFDGKLQEVGTSLGFDDVVGDDGRVPVIKVNEVTAVPTQAGFGFGEELLNQIVNRATASGRLTVLSPGNENLEKFYQRLGFEKIDPFGSDMVYSKSLPKISDTYEISFVKSSGSNVASQVVESWDRVGTVMAESSVDESIR